MDVTSTLPFEYCPPYSRIPDNNSNAPARSKGEHFSWLNRTVSVISYFKWPILIAGACALLTLTHSLALSAIVFPCALVPGLILTKALSNRTISPADDANEQDRISQTLEEPARSSTFTPEHCHLSSTVAPQNHPLFNLAMAKEITDQYATTDYNGRNVNNPDSIDWDKPIPRLFHGAQHQARTAMWALVLLQPLREFKVQHALNFHDRDIPLIILTCLFHDSGRQGEGHDTPQWEAASGLKCYTFMKRKGFSDSQANMCRNAIVSKDVTGSSPSSLIQWLLHLADGLDVIRVREKGQFKPELLQVDNPELDRYLLSPRFAELARKVEQVIRFQGDLFRHDEGCFDHELKKRYEYCNNPLEIQFESLKELSPGLYKNIQGLIPLISYN